VEILKSSHFLHKGSTVISKDIKIQQQQQQQQQLLTFVLNMHKLYCQFSIYLPTEIPSHTCA